MTPIILSLNNLYTRFFCAVFASNLRSFFHDSPALLLLIRMAVIEAVVVRTTIYSNT